MTDFKEPTLYDKYKNQSVIGWGMSEKLNGVWARWTGVEFVTRTGNKLYAPASFTAGLPRDLILEGELWIGYGQFQAVCGVVRSKKSDWSAVSFNVFNMLAKGGYSERMRLLDAVVLPAHIKVVEQVVIRSRVDIERTLKEVMARGGEGLILRCLHAQYEHGLSSRVLKLKPRQDAEAVVLGFIEGKGCLTGAVGALVVAFEGKTFKLGMGYFNQPKDVLSWIGKKVTFSYLELTSNGIPSQAGFVGVRDYE